MVDKQSNEERKKQAEYWRKKLDWYLYESDGNYDVEEVRAIIETLKILDPKAPGEEYYTVDKALDRFHKSYELRCEIYEEFEKLKAGKISLADYPDPDFPEENEATVEATVAEEDAPARIIVDKTGKNNRKKFRTTRVTKWVTAAALVVAVFLGGTIGAYAEKEGFFHKINAGEDKNTVVASPEGIETEYKQRKIFENVEEVPVKYLWCMWTPVNIPQDFKLNIIDLYENAYKIKIACEFGNDKLFLKTYKTSFKEVVAVNDQLYDGFDLYRVVSYNLIEVQYLVKENEDYNEYIALFEYENSLYSLHSNCDYETIEYIIEESIMNNDL